MGAHKDASDCAGDARPKGPSGHRPGQGPRPIDLKSQAEAEDTGEKQPHEDEAVDDADAGAAGGDLPGQHHQQTEKGKRPPHSSKRAWEGRAMLPKKKKRGRPTRNRRPRPRQCEMIARVASQRCPSGQRQAGGMSASATAGGRDGRPRGPHPPMGVA